MRKVWVIVRLRDNGIWDGYSFSGPLEAGFYLTEKSAEHNLLNQVIKSGKYPNELFELREVYKSLQN